MTPVGQTLQALEAQALAVIEGIKAVKLSVDADRLQGDLPLPGTPAAAVALVAEPALTRAAILGELDALDDALNRGDTARARAAIWNLRDALTHIHESA